jgi:hypothetical protein
MGKKRKAVADGINKLRESTPENPNKPELRNVETATDPQKSTVAIIYGKFDEVTKYLEETLLRTHDIRCKLIGDDGKPAVIPPDVPSQGILDSLYFRLERLLRLEAEICQNVSVIQRQLETKE